ncbi:MAG: glycosyltransferase family 2 protein [Desulfosporosinus sp.]|nr:glycosyltransferase family 2 protein [Desulfosporosinus sp.]
MITPIYVIVLNWNGWQDTLECIESVYNTNYANTRVVVCDNDSEDNSLEYIKKWADGLIDIKGLYNPIQTNRKIMYCELTIDQICTTNNYLDYSLTLIKCGSNLGYAGGNNVGIRYAYSVNSEANILILNNDTVISTDFISRAMELIGGQEISKLALLGFPAYDFYDRNKIQAIYVKEHWLKGPIGVQKVGKIESKSKAFLVPSILGHAMLITQYSPFKEIPEDYFLYLEESEFCYMIRKAGGKIAVNIDNKVYHKHSKTVGKESITQLYYFNRNHLFYMLKNRSFLVFLVFFILKTLIIIKKVVIYYYKGEVDRANTLIKGYCDFLSGTRGRKKDLV